MQKKKNFYRSLKKTSEQLCWLRNQVIWSAILMAALIARYCFNSHSRRVVVSMEKALYAIYLCLAESKKQKYE